MPACPVHHTATSNGTWNGPAAVAAMPNKASVLKYCHAFWDDGATGEDADVKSHYHLPHHATEGGPAVLAGVRNALARLSSADSVTDKDGARKHLEEHLQDGGGGDDDSDSHGGLVLPPARRGRPLGAGVRVLPGPAMGRTRAARMKTRAGGVLSRAGGRLTVTEQAALDGEPRALRALVRQGVGVNMLTFPGPELELRAVANGTGGTRLAFTGYATLTEFPFDMWDFFGSYVENLHSGAFTRTLGMNPDVIYCLNHDWDGAPMARTIPGTMRLSEDSLGLYTEADLDPSRADVHIVRSAIEGGELNAMSFAFWATQQTWSPDYDQRDIHEVDIDGGDTSVVTHPANPGTDGTIGLRRRQAIALASTPVPSLLMARARTERRQAGELSPATRVVLQAVLDLAAAADTALDYVQPMLADLLGCENPDDDQGDDGTTSAGNGMGMSLSRMRLREDAYRGRS